MCIDSLLTNEVIPLQGTKSDVCIKSPFHKCDLLCQNPPLTHTMSKDSFHRQWIAPSIN